MRWELMILGEPFVIPLNLFAQGQTQGSAPRAHQQAITNGPFNNTYEADAVSLEVAMGGLQEKMSRTKGILSGSNTRTIQQLYIIYQFRSTLQNYLSDLTQ
jgi:hypothetical protein